MDNEFGIVGYSKKTKNINKTNYIILTEIVVYWFVLTVILGLFSIIGIDIYTSIFFYIFSFILSIIITMIMRKGVKDLQTQKEYYLYIYFKNKNYLKNCLYLNDNYFNEIVNYIVENNIKYVKKNDYYYSIEFNIYNDERMALYNKLKDQCEVVNY